MYSTWPIKAKCFPKWHKKNSTVIVDSSNIELYSLYSDKWIIWVRFGEVKNLWFGNNSGIIWELFGIIRIRDLSLAREQKKNVMKKNWKKIANNWKNLGKICKIHKLFGLNSVNRIILCLVSASPKKRIIRIWFANLLTIVCRRDKMERYNKTVIIYQYMQGRI